jgi:hypothetical protein
MSDLRMTMMMLDNSRTVAHQTNIRLSESGGEMIHGAKLQFSLDKKNSDHLEATAVSLLSPPSSDHLGCGPRSVSQFHTPKAVEVIELAPDFLATRRETQITADAQPIHGDTTCVV